MNHQDLRYPIGKFEAPATVSPAQVEAWIHEIEGLPGRLRETVASLTPEQLATPYRPGGWTVRQVVHHLPDSHINAYVRHKWALTEECPTIKPYFEERWAELPDSAETPVETSLMLLQALHERWVVLLRGLSPADLRRELVHPESGVWRLDTSIGLYAWHGRHHLAHITHLAAREGWAL